MKILIKFIGILLLSIRPVYSQCDSSLTTSELIRIYNNVRILKYMDSTNKIIITKQQSLILDYQLLSKTDSIIISSYQQSTLLLQKNVESYKELYEDETKKSTLNFYKGLFIGSLPTIGIIMGVLLW